MRVWRINRLQELHWNSKLLNGERFFNDNYTISQSGSDYWSEVSSLIARALENNEGIHFFRNKIVVDHLASNDFRLGYNILKRIRRGEFKNFLNYVNTPAWGRPFLLREYPSLSPSTLSHLANLISVCEHFGIKIEELKNLIDFGGGYGGLARVAIQLNPEINIDIIDSKSMHLVQERFLSQTLHKSLLNSVDFFQNILELKGQNYLFNATFSLSETSLELRGEIESFLLNRCNRIFIVFQSSFNKVDNELYMQELCNILIRNDYSAKISPYDWYSTRSDVKLLIAQKNGK